jgi:tetratricopeptide (TPR) repeat protein
MLTLGALGWGSAAVAPHDQDNPQAQESEPVRLDKKQLEAKAKEIVSEGGALEKQGDLAGAFDKYVDAEGVFSTHEALSGIKRIHEAEDQKITEALAATHHTFNDARYADCVTQLEAALRIEPGNPPVHYDLALCYSKLAERTRALDHLDESTSTVYKPKRRMELLELHSQLLMGMDLATDPPAEIEDRLASFNQAYVASARDPGDITTSIDNKDAANGQHLCGTAKELQHDIPDNPAVDFNEAKCAEEDAHPEEAARLLAEYLKLAPHALDAAAIETRRQQLTSLGALPGDPGKVVREHYAIAARYLDYRRYDRAITEYEAAQTAMPDYPQTAWRLGLLYESYGDAAKAQASFARYQQLDPSPNAKIQGDTHLRSMEGRRALYEAGVAEGQEILTDLLLHSMGISTQGTKHKAHLTRQQRRWASGRYKRTLSASEKLSPPYVERQLERARDLLEKSSELFPLGVEANELLALIYLESNDWPAAFRSFDSPAGRNLPVSFYAQVNSVRDSQQVRAAKVEITSNKVRLVYLSSYDNSKHITGPPKSPAGDDDLGNLVVSEASEMAKDADVFTVPAADIVGVETKNNFVVLKLKDDDLYLAPVYMMGAVPFEGRASRTFGNEYTRLFIRYLGYEDAKLGIEGMSPGDKFKLGLAVGLTGLAVFNTVRTFGAGSYGAYGSALHVAELIHVLMVARTAFVGVHLAVTAVDTDYLIQNIRVDTATVQRTGADQRQVLEGLEFKIIPTEPSDFEYREKL